MPWSTRTAIHSADDSFAVPRTAKQPAPRDLAGESSAEYACDWIPGLAEPYLRGYAPRFESGNSLLGYRFSTPHSTSSQVRKTVSRESQPHASAGFFVGYLLDTRGLPFLKCAPPEFLLFCFVEPVRSRLHRGLVTERNSLLRRTTEYIRWLTHRPPRFELFPEERAALVRHIPMQEWPASRTGHYAQNFAIETLAWLVRSGLVRRLPEEVATASLSASKNLARHSSRSSK
jgi:hypothetical protein